MIVISKISNKKLLKGHRYEVNNLWNNGNNQRWTEGQIELVGFGRYSVSGFTDDSGNKIPKINYKSIVPQIDRFIKFEDVSVGEILVCNADHYKTMARGSMYRVENLENVKIEMADRRWTSAQKSIKFEGVSRKLKFNGWNFRKLTSEESREISLNNILHNEAPKVIKTTNIRKIDLVINKNKALMEVISKTLLDTNRHHLSIIDWSCSKTGENLRINPDDFKELLDMRLSDILLQIEK